MLAEIFFILILSFILAALLAPVGGYTVHRGPWRGRRLTEDKAEKRASQSVGATVTLLFFFLVIFPLIFAGNAWITPYGPIFMGVAWVPLIFFGILIALLIAALSPRRSSKPATVDKESEDAQESAGTLFGLFFFLLLILAIAAALLAPA